MEDISISIITIVKDNERLLPRAVDSVLHQEFLDFEYIIINDGSTDGTKNLIDSYANNDSRINAVHMPHNIGRSFARNIGLDSAKGRYILFLDADDYLAEDALTVLCETGEKNQADIVYGGTVCFDILTDKILSHHYTDDIIDHERHNFTVNDHFPLVNNHHIVGRLYRRELLSLHNIRFSTKRKNAEDVLFTFYAAFFAKNISMIPSKKVYFYGLGNFIGTANESKLYDARDNLLETILFAVENGSIELQQIMWKKGAEFVGNLDRAEKIFKVHDDRFFEFVTTLTPLVEGIDDATKNSLSLYHREFAEALLAGEYVNACNLWKWPALNKKKMACLETELEILNHNTARLALELERLYRSTMWKMTSPFRYIYKKKKKLPPKNKAAKLTSSETISIIIPIYNVENFLRPCLDSVISQTYKEIEIICVNDYSPDNSQTILEEYAEKDSRVILITHEKNKGLPAARNTGMNAATGQFLYFLDSDDLLADCEALETLHRVSIEDNADEVIGGVLKWDEYTGEKFMDWHENYLKNEDRGKSLDQLPQLWANVVAWNKLIRKDLLDKHNITFNEKLKKHEDNPFSCKVHILARKISIIPITTYLYRQAREGSITSREDKIDAFYRCTYCSEIFSFIESKVGYHKFRKMYYPMYSRHLIESAGIISHFPPTEEEKLTLMRKWADVISVMRPDFPYIPGNLCMIFFLVRQGDFQQAWQKAIAWNNNKDTMMLFYTEPKNMQSVIPIKRQLSNLRVTFNEMEKTNAEIVERINRILKSRSSCYYKRLKSVIQIKG